MIYNDFLFYVEILAYNYVKIQLLYNNFYMLISMIHTFKSLIYFLTSYATKLDCLILGGHQINALRGN